jgi:hypothetical protein
MGMFDALTDCETHILVGKLMSGATTSDYAYGNDQHELTMELYGVVTDVQTNYKRSNKK